MNEKIKQPEKNQTPIVKIALIAAASYCIATSSFSRSVREFIWSRDRGKCQECDGHNCTSKLECAHYDHDRRNPDYDNPDNGRLLCTGQHLVDHREGAGDNGLSLRDNEHAIKSLKKRVQYIDP